MAIDQLWEEITRVAIPKYDSLFPWAVTENSSLQSISTEELQVEKCRACQSYDTLGLFEL